MRELLTVVTRKGQITVPAEIRKTLGLHVGDKVALSLEDNEVRLKRADSVVARTAGIFRTAQPPLSAEQLREAAEIAIAEDNAARAAR
ncbi:MAG TPA: AbrB/MazE/SpoVT family DNA-binding domain-containing protein [Chloroflexota bacterium]|jgi:AbrB family looped-hinge helix DNA binding protein|nr:AbrB/MazE/SpoVT family DNA-binding domain-containing protein [Chloroflexota bacterium]